MTLEEIILVGMKAILGSGLSPEYASKEIADKCLSWFKEQLPSVDELRQAMESKWITMENSYSPRFKEYAETVHAIILTNLTAKQGER
jgi:hypothetical protein